MIFFKERMIIPPSAPPKSKKTLLLKYTIVLFLFKNPAQATNHSKDNGF